MDLGILRAHALLVKRLEKLLKLSKRKGNSMIKEEKLLSRRVSIFDTVVLIDLVNGDKGAVKKLKKQTPNRCLKLFQYTWYVKVITFWFSDTVKLSF